MPARRLMVSVASLALMSGGVLAVVASSNAASSTTQTLKLSAVRNQLRFNVNKLSAKAGTVKIVMANPKNAGLPHSVAIRGKGVNSKGRVVNPGGTSTATAKLKRGTYTFYCTVPGHEAGGMKGTLTVR